MVEIVRRVEAAQAVLDLYENASFGWGKRDCLTMIAAAAWRLGHKEKPPLYTTKAGALRALAKQGAADTEALLDARFPRIAVASAVASDVLLLPPNEPGPLAALALHLGSGRMLFAAPRSIVEEGEEPAEGLTFTQGAAEYALAAWRIPVNG